MKEIMQKALIIVVFITVVCGLLFVEISIDNANWNEGYCDRCGGKWVFTNGSIEKQRKTYWYTCEDCGNVISTSCAME